jgi:hypothetical protein
MPSSISRFPPLCQENIIDKNGRETRNALQTRGIFFQRKGLRLAPLFPHLCHNARQTEKMSNKSKTSAARTAQPVPVPAGGPLPAAFSSPISAFQFFSVSAFASVTLTNCFGKFYEVFCLFCWNPLFYNILQPMEKRTVTFVTLPQPIYFFLAL